MMEEARSGAAEIAAERSARRDLREALEELHAREVDAGLRRRVPRSRWILATLVAVVAVVLAGVAVVAWSGARNVPTDDDFERAAADRVAVLIAPDHRDPSRARKILAGATGTFYDEFAQSADSYSAFVQANGSVSKSSVDGTGVSARDGDSATVLVAATVVFDTAGETGEGQARRFRLRVLVAPDDGSLKLGAVQYLP
ncbi:hypothetical protein FOV72_06875 [Gordonia rubripertincta]|uniref:Mce-associated membrane protein n=2 Tax=Gordonia rubripertincta TaxID=36822 RepID=A0AAW4G0K6_GORRU|nr:hypothetical protein [Gordonia rubripertincta]ASR04620.1 hypothetical protein GCWB2_19235 [Gordonia rubripertincta]MBM7276981.1 hypothetical protein [Gordonia rubripertincta]QMU23112.1 hypothetical protein H3V45_00225 [Gordonia rubripertincta]TSD97999.1 hypothetical protein FOV72_06875 [Gordonia rubripertincta]